MTTLSYYPHLFAGYGHVSTTVRKWSAFRIFNSILTVTTIFIWYKINAQMILIAYICIKEHITEEKHKTEKSRNKAILQNQNHTCTGKNKIVYLITVKKNMFECIQ